MANNALPLLLVAGAFLLMKGKKKNGSSADGEAGTIITVDAGDTEEALLAEIGEDRRICSVMSTIAAFSKESVTSVVAPFAQENPDITFVVIAGDGIDALVQWYGGDADAVKNSGILGVALGKTLNMNPEGFVMKTGIGPEDAAKTIADTIRQVLTPSSQGSPGVTGRGLAGAGPTMANSTGNMPVRITAMRQPAPSGNVFESLFKGATQSVSR